MRAGPAAARPFFDGGARLVRSSGAAPGTARNWCARAPCAPVRGAAAAGRHAFAHRITPRPLPVQQQSMRIIHGTYANMISRMTVRASGCRQSRSASRGSRRADGGPTADAPSPLEPISSRKRTDLGERAAAAAGGRGGCRRGHLQRPEREHLHGHPHAEVSRLLTLRRRRASFLCRRSTRHKQQRTQRKHERSGYMPLTTQPGYHWVSPRTPKSAEKVPAQRAP